MLAVKNLALNIISYIILILTALAVIIVWISKRDYGCAIILKFTLLSFPL
jgi:uncharacterized MnhB-related membrane protein